MFKIHAKRHIIGGLLLCFTSLAHTVPQNRLTALSSPSLSSLNQAIFLQPTAPDTEINFTVWLKNRNQDWLNKMVFDIYNPQSPRYQKFLTQEDLSAQYYPVPESENLVKDYFVQQGMHAKIINHTIRVTASVEQINESLHTRINNYQYSERVVYANDSAPTVDTALAEHVSMITGLDNIPRIRPLALRTKEIFTVEQGNLPNPNLSFPNGSPVTPTLSGFSGANLQKAYGLTNDGFTANGITYDGTGQTIVILDVCDSGSSLVNSIKSDTNLYNSHNGLKQLTSSNFAIVTPTGSPFTACNFTNTGWYDEIILDIDAVHTIAPGANIVLVLSQTDDLLTAAFDVSQLLINSASIGGFKNAHVISNSWAGSEFSGQGTYDSLIFTPSAAAGFSWNFATGDCGDQTYDSPSCSSMGGSPSVNYPSSSPFVTAVGGSSLFVDSNGNYSFETGWGTYYLGFYFGGTGGRSAYSPFPAWQSSISSFSAGGYGTVGSTHRALPDIGMLADPLTGLIIYILGGPTPIGGTSLATPLFSGTLTLVNQARQVASHVTTGHSIGLAAPYFYAFNAALVTANALNVIVSPHILVPGETFSALPSAPLSAVVFNTTAHVPLAFSWDSSLTIVENQFWNDVIGVGSPNIASFVQTMAKF